MNGQSFLARKDYPVGEAGSSLRQTALKQTLRVS